MYFSILCLLYCIYFCNICSTFLGGNVLIKFWFRLSARIASEVSLWVCHLFRFINGAAFCHDDTREGLVKITRMALHQHYPKMCQDGFEALFSRPPVIYLTSNTYVDIAHYVCMQLGLPLSTVSLTFVFQNSSTRYSEQKGSDGLVRYMKVWVYHS